MFNKKPKIGITGPDKGGAAAWFFTALSIRLAGGKPVRIIPASPMEIDRLDGLIIGGGADVEPLTYNQERMEKTPAENKNKRTFFEWILSILFFPVYWLVRYITHTKTAPIDPKRDELELNLIKNSLDQKKPVLGICRGMQLLNVYFRGTLHQDISGFYSEHPQISSIFPKKRITVLSGSLLQDLLKTNKCNVNALHKQAINKPGEGVEFTARELNTDIIQGIEHKEYPFVIGVQWHPEYLIQIKRQRNIFKELVRNAEYRNSEFRRQNSE
ncbi:MAG: type 1 glutamine amidotransferase [Balneolaceae bacterium]